MDRILKPDCNRCQPSSKCSGVSMTEVEGCFTWRKPSDTFSFAELALEHPQGIQDTFRYMEGIDLNLIQVL